jgi:Lamin Tail Domain
MAVTALFNTTLEVEWIELYNRGPTTQNLRGWFVHERNANWTIDADIMIVSGGYAVLTSGTPVGFTSDYILEGLKLNNGRDFVLLRDPDRMSVVHDFVGFNSSAWPIAERYSIQLRGPTLDNSVPASWCSANQTVTTSFDGGTHFGTPGAINDCTI